MLKKEILHKYNVAAPRYTSYPPANFFDESFSAEDYRVAVLDSNRQQPEHISIYIHIPFCYHMCYYCGCNSVQMQSKKVVAEYISALKKEMKMLLSLLDRKRKISQIHYGGGSPSSLPVSALKEINDVILKEFDCIERPEIAIECHPGYLDESYWKDLAKASFNRVSLGIQDFNEEVLKIVNRRPSRIEVSRIMNIIRSSGMSVNMDFIFGLPRQTSQSFTRTIEKAISMSPDRIVTFSYAHVPWVNSLQFKLEEAGLPSVDEKEEMYAIATKLLVDAGYNTIGMDHFVRPDDELYIASQSNQLHRNFQGYCTRRTTGQVYALGATGISQLATAYSQNTKDIQSYIAQVEREEFPILKGYLLNREEQLAREVITRLMCNYSIYWNQVSAELNVSVAKLKSAMHYDESRLKEFEADGIIEYTDDYICILPEAKPFVRNVAASLDKLMQSTDRKFSKTV